MATEIIPADQVALAEQARLFTEAFRGYVGGSLELDASGLGRFLCAQGADLCHSRLACRAEGVCGFAYLGRTGDVSRICAMGILPESRRSGVARDLLEHLIAEANARGDQALLLEVIEQNPAAHRLYQEAGFREISHLLSWRKPASDVVSGSSGDSNALTEVSLIRASQSPSAFEFPDIPWQISRHAVAKLVSVSAFSLGNTVVVISNPKLQGPIRVHAVFGPESAEKWSLLGQALQLVLRDNPEREFFAPAVFPESFGRELFAPLNFNRDPLNQFLMRYDLKSKAERLR